MGHVGTKNDITFAIRAGSTGSRRDYVEESLRERLRDGRLQPGDRLNAVKLARDLGVSRTPVHEALNRLERDGLLVIQPRHGAIITDLEPGQARELYIMREMLQGKAARLAARNATDVEIHTLRDMLEDQKRSFDNTPQFVRHNQHFHDAIFQMAHNRYLLQVVNMFHSSLALLRSTNFLPPGGQYRPLRSTWRSSRPSNAATPTRRRKRRSNTSGRPNGCASSGNSALGNDRGLPGARRRRTNVARARVAVGPPSPLAGRTGAPGERVGRTVPGPDGGPAARLSGA